MQFNPASPKESNGSKLLSRYVHNSNITIQPISLDLTTGIFTTDIPIGLVPGTIKNVLIGMNYMKNGCVPREFKSIDSHRIEVIDDYSFYLQAGTTRLSSYPNVNNTAVDVSTFRFEYNFSQPTININNLNLTSFKAVYRGQRERGGWSYVYLNADHSKGNMNQYFSGITDGRNMMSLFFELDFRYSPTSKLFIHQVTNYIATTFNETNGTWTQSSATSNIGQYINILEDLHYNSLKFSFGVANGTVIEIYETGWDG